MAVVSLSLSLSLFSTFLFLFASLSLSLSLPLSRFLLPINISLPFITSHHITSLFYSPMRPRRTYHIPTSVDIQHNTLLGHLSRGINSATALSSEPFTVNSRYLFNFCLEIRGISFKTLVVHLSLSRYRVHHQRLDFCGSEIVTFVVYTSQEFDQDFKAVQSGRWISIR